MAAGVWYNPPIKLREGRGHHRKQAKGTQDAVGVALCHTHWRYQRLALPPTGAEAWSLLRDTWGCGGAEILRSLC